MVVRLHTDNSLQARFLLVGGSALMKRQGLSLKPQMQNGLTRWLYVVFPRGKAFYDVVVRRWGL